MTAQNPSLPGSGIAVRVLRDDGKTYIGAVVPAELYTAGAAANALRNTAGITATELARVNMIQTTKAYTPTRPPMSEGPGWAVFHGSMVTANIARDDGATYFSYSVDAGNFNPGSVASVLAAIPGLSASELLRARGVAGGVISGGTPGPTPTLPLFRAAMAKSKAGTGLTKIVMFGNSTFAGVGDNGSGSAFVKSASTPTLLATKITARGYNTSVESFFSDNGVSTVNNDPVATYDPRISYTNWTFAKPTNSIGNITFAGTLLQASVAGASFNFAPTTAFDTFELYYFESTTAGNLQIKVDGTVVQTLNQQNASPSSKKVVITVAKGTHTLSFTSATSANVFIAGVIAYDSTQSPVIVINAGKSGGFAKEATSQFWYGQLPILQVIAPDLTVIAEDINEWAYDATNTSGYLTALQGIVTAAKVSGDAILCTNFSSQTTGSFVASLPQATQDSIAAVTRQAAASASGVPLIDMYADLGTGDAAAAAGKMFDQLHRNATGYAEVATYLDAKIAALAAL